MKPIFLAGLLDDYPIPGSSGMGAAMKERLIVLAALLVVMAIVLAWAFLSRRSRRRAARREERRHRGSFTSDATKGAAEINKYVRQRQERRRRRHRPRNPTLAETGGLPPLRKDGQPPPTPPP